MTPAWRWCPACGASVMPAPTGPAPGVPAPAPGVPAPPPVPHLPPPPPPLPPSRGARRWLVALVAVVVGVAIITGIALVTRGGDDEIAAYDGPYPDAAEQNFTLACTATSGGRADYCRCVLRHIEQQLSYAEFLELDRQFRTPGATVPNLQRYAAGCLPPVTRQA